MKKKWHAVAGLAGLGLIAFYVAGKPAPARISENKRPEVSATAAVLVVQEQPTASDLLGGLDPALGEALRESDANQRSIRLKQWAATVKLTDMENVLALLAEIEDEALRSETYAALLSSWAGRDLRGMAAWYGKGKVPSTFRGQAQDAIMKELAAREPTEIFSWMERSFTDDARTELYVPFFRQWAASDPQAAATKLQQLTDGAQGRSTLWNHLIFQVAAVWDKSDRPATLAWIQSLPEGNLREVAMEQAVLRWADLSPSEASTWVEGQKDQNLLNSVATKWAETDGAAAAKWASGLAPENGRDHAISKVASIWAGENPLAASKWAERFPEGPAREQVMGQLVTSWAAKDPAEAGDWLRKLPDSWSRDLAVSAYCGATSSADPKTSFEWAASINDQELRNEKMEKVAMVWMKKQPEKARQLIVASSLPESSKRRLLAPE